MFVYATNGGTSTSIGHVTETSNNAFNKVSAKFKKIPYKIVVFPVKSKKGEINNVNTQLRKSAFDLIKILVP